MSLSEASGDEITCVCQSDVTCAANEGDYAPHKALRWFVSNDKGDVVHQPVGQTFPYGSKIEYSCDEGYVLTGDDVRKCTEDGWTGRRTSCEEAPFAGLTNFHIAIIASAASAFVILVITIALVICCCRDHKKKRKKRKQNQLRRMRAARDNDGFVMNFAMAGNDDFLYGNTVDRRGRNIGFTGRHNDIRRYQSRPHVLPTSSVNHAHPPAQQATPTRQPRPRSNLFPGEIRPNGNRTFRPSQQNMRTPLQSRNVTSQPTNNISSVTKIITPPPGYQDPPPSYDTMVKEGWSKYERKKANRRLI